MITRDSLTISVDEAAQQLGIGRALAYELVRLGTIPSLRLGRRVRIPRDRLERMIDGITGSPAEKAVNQ